MMFELVFVFMFAAALLGSLAAGLWDLKTTDIPDEITALMAASGLFAWYVYGFATGDFWPLAASLAAGSIFLAFGWLFYKAGQWGGGDATLMAGIGFMIPIFPDFGLFSFSFFINVFIIGVAWNIIYSLAYGAGRQLGLFEKKANVIDMTMSEIRNPLFLAAAAVPMLLLAFFILNGFANLSIFAFALLLLAIFFSYAKVLEQKLFRKSVSAKELREGDVLLNSKLWVGLEKSDAEKLRKSRKRYIIKTGVPFGMAFPLALLATYLFGNLVFLIMEFLMAGW